MDSGAAHGHTSSLMAPLDAHGRPLRNLRISVTDRCNLRCSYCMPEESYVWLPREDILDFEELSTLVDCFTDLGVDRVRLTGGEPLLRHGVAKFVRMLADRSSIRDLALTTNGILLADQAAELAAAGLHRLTVSLDTLREDRFRELTRRDSLPRVLEGIAAADAAGFRPLKIDTVAMRGVNDDEICDLIEYGKRYEAEVRFIEYMDVGGATRWSRERVVTRDQIIELLSRRYGKIVAATTDPSAPADRFALPDGTVFGIISSTTQPFCSACDRARLTADGMWYLCLYARIGTDLRGLLRSGKSRGEIVDKLRQVWSGRSNRGAEKRLSERGREALLSPDQLRTDPHLEMHTRGG